MAGYEVLKIAALLVIMVLLWPLVQHMVLSYDAAAGYIDPGNMVLLVAAALISYLMVLLLSGWLLRRGLAALGLPGLGIMVLQFKKLELWQQLGFYWASFALLLLAAVLCMAAIC